MGMTKVQNRAAVTTPPPCLLPSYILRPAGLLLPLFLPQDVVNAPADLLGLGQMLFSLVLEINLGLLDVLFQSA